MFDVMPSGDGTGIVVRLSNCTTKQASVQLHIPNRKIKTAYRTNALEEIQSEITGIQNHTLMISLEEKGMLHLQVLFES